MGTMGLTLEQRGAYCILLDMMYDRENPIPDEPRYIAGVLDISVRKWNAIRSQLIDAGKIVVTEDGQLDNYRARKERENALKIKRANEINGAKGGYKKAKKHTTQNKINGITSAPARKSLPQSPENRSSLPESRSQNPPVVPLKTDDAWRDAIVDATGIDPGRFAQTKRIDQADRDMTDLIAYATRLGLTPEQTAGILKPVAERKRDEDDPVSSLKFFIGVLETEAMRRGGKPKPPADGLDKDLRAYARTLGVSEAEARTLLEQARRNRAAGGG